MINIAIVSRVHGINYGANLQAVALQSVLRLLDVNPCYLDYKVKYSNHGIRKVLSWGYSVIRLLFGYSVRVSKTKAFKRQYLIFSRPLKRYQDLVEISDTYDYFMSGSDQVWNPRYLAQSNGLYLLEFTNKIKVSYASSFGVNHLPEALISRYKNSLSSFSSISVRETTGAAIIQKMGLDCQVVIDPTLLLKTDQWKDFFSLKPIINTKYVCCYVMPGDEQCVSAVLNLAKHLNRNNCQLIVLGDKEYKRVFNNRSVKYFTTAGPSEFLNILYHSEFVITSSFHGTCFSLLFNKLFYSVINDNNDVNSRIIDLLTTLGLESRIVSTKAISSVDNLHHINYSIVNDLLEERRHMSICYLKSILIGK